MTRTRPGPEHIGTTGASAGDFLGYDADADEYAPMPVSGGSGGGSFNPDAGRPPRLVPYGVKLRGGNLVPKDSVGNPWKNLYANWGTRWGTIIKPQIDAAANSGANALRLIGDVAGVHTGLLTLDAYLAAYEQFVDYAANLGMWVYAVASDAGHWEGATKDQALDIMTAQAAMLDTKPNVFGIDVCQEIGLNGSLWSGSTLHDFIAYLFGPMRAATTLPLTCSNLPSSNSSSAQWSSSTTAALADQVDFYDFHPYYDGMTAADLAPLFAATTKPVVLGEYGGATTDGRYTAAAAVSALPQVIGSFVWAIQDNMSGEGNGLFDYSLTERTNRTDIFRTVPDHDGDLPAGGRIIQDEGTTLPLRGRLNFVGAGVTAADDSANDATTVAISGGGLTVQDENGTVATGVTQLDFQGAGVTAAAGSGEVVVTIPVSPGSELLMQDGVTAPPVPIENEARSDWLYQG